MSGEDAPKPKGKATGDMAVTGCFFGIAMEFVLFLGALILWGALNMPVIGLLMVTLGVFLPIIGIIWGRKQTVESGGQGTPKG